MKSKKEHDADHFFPKNVFFLLKIRDGLRFCVERIVYKYYK